MFSKRRRVESLDQSRYRLKKKTHTHPDTDTHTHMHAYTKAFREKQKIMFSNYGPQLLRFQCARTTQVRPL